MVTGRVRQVVVFTVTCCNALRNWVQRFKCIISHSSTESLVPPLHEFIIRKLDLFFAFFWEIKFA